MSLAGASEWTPTLAMGVDLWSETVGTEDPMSTLFGAGGRRGMEEVTNAISGWSALGTVQKHVFWFNLI